MIGRTDGRPACTAAPKIKGLARPAFAFARRPPHMFSTTEPSWLVIMVKLFVPFFLRNKSCSRSESAIAKSHYGVTSFNENAAAADDDKFVQTLSVTVTLIAA